MTETIFVFLSFASNRVSSTTAPPDSLYTQKIALVSVYKYCCHYEGWTKTGPSIKTTKLLS